VSAHILVVDDDLEIRRLLSRYLGEQGFRVSLAGGRAECEEKLANENIDLVVLDVMLPDGSGLDICRALRNRTPPVSIILVTALKEEVDRILGLELGADDYLGKPFSPRELVARMRAVLRRVPASVPVTAAAGTLYRFDGFTLDASTRTVIDAQGKAVELTGAEYQLLQVFLDRPGRVLSREQLLDLTQARESNPFDRSIDVLMSRLRRKFRQAGTDNLFKTIRNGGYQLSTRVETSGIGS
jgi:two-component system, OmpR family, response regulator